jgi:hypothetical protein
MDVGDGKSLSVIYIYIYIYTHSGQGYRLGMEVHQNYFFGGKFSLGISQNCLGKLDIIVKSKL